MTSGDAAGASGEWFRRLGPTVRFYCVFGLLAAAICMVNIGSRLIESPPGERHFQVWEPVLWEMSSLMTLLALLWLWPLIYYRFHFNRIGRWRFAVVQVAGFLLFTLSHVAGMVAIRGLIYGLAGYDYDFAQGNLWLQLIYEGRKDALGYIGILANLWVDERLCPTPVAQTAQRIEIRDGGRIVFIDPQDILWIEAAGNYVEIHTSARKWLTRGVLSQFEARLAGEGFVRIHRSRLLNRRHAHGLTALPSGDVMVHLKDGRSVGMSRRYKAAL